jgi:hypothetical protein
MIRGGGTERDLRGTHAADINGASAGAAPVAPDHRAWIWPVAEPWTAQA